MFRDLFDSRYHWPNKSQLWDDVFKTSNEWHILLSFEVFRTAYIIYPIFHEDSMDDVDIYA